MQENHLGVATPLGREGYYYHACLTVCSSRSGCLTPVKYIGTSISTLGWILIKGHALQQRKNKLSPSRWITNIPPHQLRLLPSPRAVTPPPRTVTLPPPRTPPHASCMARGLCMQPAGSCRARGMAGDAADTVPNKHSTTLTLTKHRH